MGSRQLVVDSHHKPKLLPFFININSNQPSRFLYEPLIKQSKNTDDEFFPDTPPKDF